MSQRILEILGGINSLHKTVVRCLVLQIFGHQLNLEEVTLRGMCEFFNSRFLLVLVLI
jgi:hypothetical protein